MPRNDSAQSPLLAQSEAHPPLDSSTSNDSKTSVAATLSQWDILRFIIATPMSCSRWTAFLYVVVGVGASAGTGIALAYYARYTGQLNRAGKNKDGPSYDDAILNIIFVIIGTMLSQGVSTYCMKRIGLMKRVHLNRTLHYEYFRSKNFYVLNAFNSDELDSIDSRLTSDIHTMTSEFFSILQVVLYCLAAIVQGVVLLLEKNAASLSMIGLACLVLFSFIVAALLKVISARVSARVCDLKRDEGSFSFQHTRIKKNCESIAFYSGQTLELQKIKCIFEAVLRSSRNLVKWQMILDFLGFVNTYAINSNLPQWIGFLCYLRVSTSNQKKDQEFVSDAYQLYNSLLSQTFQRFVTIAAVAGPLSASIGCGARVLHLKRRLDDMHARADVPPCSPAHGSELNSLPTFSDTSVVQLSNICVRVPHSERELVTGLNIIIPGNVLLMGPSGCGKSSVLRVIAGLWPAAGHIKAPAVGRSGMCFLTQRPYMCPVSLRQNVAYPSQDFLSDGDLKRLLGMSGLAELFDRTSNFDEVLDWANILSLGEQQRMAFARCFHMMPRVAILDESTSALDPDNEEHLYQTLRSLNINFISVGHRSQLKAFHDQLVEFDGQGHFSSSLIQAIPVPIPPAHDVLQPATSAKFTSLAVPETSETEVLKTPMSRFRHLFGVLFLRKESAKNLIVHFLIVLIFVAESCSVLYSKNIVFSRGIYYFEDTSLNDFLSFIFVIVVIAALEQTISNALIAYVSLRTRKNLCREMHKLYFEDNNYYKFNTASKGLPDAHSIITSDADKFTSMLPSIMWRPTNLTSLGNANLTTDSQKSPAFLGSWLNILMSTYFIYSRLVLGDLNTLWSYIGYFSAALLIINIPTVKKISAVAENLAQCESKFKFAHSRIRLHAETIALYSAEDVEKSEIARSFDDVIENSKILIAWQSVFQSLQVLFQYVPFIISVQTAKAYVSDPKTSVADQVQYTMVAATAWRALLNCFYYVGALSETVGYGNRVTKFLDKATNSKDVSHGDEFSLKSEPTGKSAVSRRALSRFSSRSHSQHPSIVVAEFSHVTVKNPANTTLIEDLCLQIYSGQGCLISGPSGCGKSSILRVVGRLWPAAAGCVKIPQHVGPDGVFFLPQRPYMTNSSLRDEVTYPSSASVSQLALGTVVDDRICELLETFGLLHLAEMYQLDTPRNWEDLLSLGEQQRIAIIRLMLHRPALAILDECTSAISESQQETFYRLLRSLKIAYISVGHRPELFGFHDTVLRVAGRGSTKYSLISQECKI